MTWSCRRRCPNPCIASLSPCFAAENDPRDTLRLLKNLCPGRLLVKKAGLTILQNSSLLTPGEGGNDFIEFDSNYLNHLKIILFQCPVGNCLRSALVNQKSEIVSHLILDSVPWHSAEADALRSQLNIRPVQSSHCFEHCELWLDDWSEEPLSPPRSRDITVTKELLRSCSSLKVSVQREEFRLESKLNPSFIDTDQSIIRFADHRQRHVVYADLNQVDFQFQQNLLAISC